MTGSLLDEAVSDERLGAVLDTLMADAANDERGVSRSLRALDGQRPEQFERLRDDASSSDWRPRPLVSVQIPKSDGGIRELGIPCVRERLLERSLLSVLAPLVDPHLGPASFGYRSGIGVGDAIRRIVELRSAGFSAVFRTDIDDCFPSIDRGRVIRRLGVLVDGDPIVELVGKLIGRPYRVRKAIEFRTGLPQGGALSPLLSNLLLAEFDDELLGEGFQVVRYADDCVVLVERREELPMAQEVANRAAERLGLRLGDDKTRLTDFAEGFAFLGEEMNERYPPAESAERIDSPDSKVLYVGVQGSYLFSRGGRIRVTRKKVELASVPQSRVARIVTFGSVTLSPGVRAWALSSDVDIVFCSRRGSLTGFLAGPGPGQVVRRRKQYRLADDVPASVEIATEFIDSKLHNQRVLLQRYVRRDVRDVVRPSIDEISSYRGLLDTAATRNEVLGLEGIAARRYWEAFVALVPEDVSFEGRVARPPGDVVNAALSYGYAILLGETTTACVAAGLDPAVGFLHADQDRRPSLALDLMEEFRPVIVDSVVLELVRRRSLTPEHGRLADTGSGVWLTEKGRRALTAAIERRLLAITHDLGLGRRVPLRRIVHLQAQRLARTIDNGDRYVGYRRRV